MCRRDKRRKVSFSNRAGFSVIELMVAMAIALLLLLGLTIMFSNANLSFRELHRTSQQLENGRYALQVIREDARLAGFYGGFTDLRVPDDMVNPCSVALADLRTAVESLPLQGYNDAMPAADLLPLAACVNNRRPNTDILVVRRAATTQVAGALDDDRIYVQGLVREYRIGPGPDVDFFDIFRTNGDREDIFPMVVRIYYIRNDAIPTLVRAELGPNGTMMNTVPLAEGIENIVFRYGIDQEDVEDPISPFDGRPDTYLLANEMTDTDWGNVVALEISLLSRTLEPSQDYTDSKVYSLADGELELGPFNDAFKRQVFSSVVRIENVSQRRGR